MNERASEHRLLREQLGAYALDQLPPPEQVGVQGHLDGCDSCWAEVTDLMPAVEALRRVDVTRLPRTFETLPAPPPGLGGEILRRARAEGPPRRTSAVRRGGPRLLAAAAVVVALGIGLGAGYGLAPDVPSRPLEAVAVQAATGIEATAAVVPHTWGMEVELTASGFTAGQAYQVVVLDRTGRQVGAGEFVGTGDAPMRCSLNSSVLRRDAAGFLITDATGQEVLTSRLT